MKSQLAGLKGVGKMARQRTSPRRSGSGKSLARSMLRLLAAILIKAKNGKCANYNGFSFIGVVRVQRKHTS
jgi:hypothetical protein